MVSVMNLVATDGADPPVCPRQSLGPPGPQLPNSPLLFAHNPHNFPHHLAPSSSGRLPLFSSSDQSRGATATAMLNVLPKTVNSGDGAGGGREGEGEGELGSGDLLGTPQDIPQQYSNSSNNINAVQLAPQYFGPYHQMATANSLNWVQTAANPLAMFAGIGNGGVGNGFGTGGEGARGGTGS